jgi:hypothetical protein
MILFLMTIFAFDPDQQGDNEQYASDMSMSAASLHRQIGPEVERAMLDGILDNEAPAAMEAAVPEYMEITQGRVEEDNNDLLENNHGRVQEGAHLEGLCYVCKERVDNESSITLQSFFDYNFHHVGLSLATVDIHNHELLRTRCICATCERKELAYDN